MKSSLPPDLLRNLGIFTRADFLEPEIRQRVFGELKVAPRARAPVYKGKDSSGQDRYELGESTRRTKTITVSEELRDLVATRLESITEALEQAFDIELTSFQQVQFLGYEPGDFHLPHADAAEQGEDAPEYGFARKISAVVLVNDQSEEPQDDTYGGGSLVFGGLLPTEGVGVPVVLPAGAMLAFRSHVIHEVKPVTHGERYSIVAWYV